MNVQDFENLPFSKPNGGIYFMHIPKRFLKLGE